MPPRYPDPGIGFTQRGEQLGQQSAEAEANALQYLHQALNSSQEISPQQGIAAAILAAVPTLGGYLMGKSMGKTEVPEGLYNVGKLAPTGGFAGGLSGLDAGIGAANGYLKGIEADDARKGGLLEKMSVIEKQKADRLAQEANSAINAGLNVQSEVAMLPLKEESQIRVHGAENAQSLASQKEMADYTANRDAIPKDLIEFANKNGIEIPSGVKASQLNAITAAKEAMRREAGQDIRLSGRNVMPPSAATKTAMVDILKTKTIGERYISKLENLAKQDPSYLTRNIEKVLPATELGQLQKDMELFGVQVRNARENGVMTEPDFQRYKSYLSIGPLDTMQSVLGRMRELQKITDLSASAVLKAAKAGSENVSGYEELLGLGAENKPSIEPVVPPSALPSVGGTFNGSKVLSVKRIS